MPKHDLSALVSDTGEETPEVGVEVKPFLISGPVELPDPTIKQDFAVEPVEIEEKAYIPPHLRELNLSEIVTQSTAMAQLNAVLPRNDWELPEIIYRPDLVDWKILVNLRSGERAKVEEVIQMLDAAKVVLDYDEGFPAINNEPLWHRLPWEPVLAYTGLQQYLEIVGTRRLDKLDAFERDILQEWFHSYMWPVRVVAFDLYTAANHQRQKVQLALSLEGRHHAMTENILVKLEALLHEDDFITPQQVSPKQAVEMMERLAKLQRISVGLPANQGADQTLTPTPIGVSMRRIVDETRQETDESKEVNMDSDEIDALMEDPEALEAAQKLIIRAAESKNA